MDPGDTLKSPRGVYKIGKKLGEGTFGKVYLADYTAKNASNSKQVAVKEIALHGMDEKEKEECEKEKEECEKEGKLMEKISESSTNQHIVKHLDSFIGKVVTGKIILRLAGMKSPSHDNLFIAMNYCSRGDLRSKIKENFELGKEFDPEIVYDYIYQIADGINELHVKHKIAHRDLKPANILIAWENEKEVLKISDFGLAKVIESLKSLSYSKVCGTPLYMAPEQYAATRYQFSVDTWAIGIIFYELCIAPKKLDDDEIKDLRGKIMDDQRVNLPNRYSASDTIWLNKMIAKESSERMKSDQVRDEARGESF